MSDQTFCICRVIFVGLNVSVGVESILSLNKKLSSTTVVLGSATGRMFSRSISVSNVSSSIES